MDGYNRGGHSKYSIKVHLISYKEKLKEEIEEFLSSQNPDELADIYIVIVQLANILNSDLQTLVNDKMKINRELKWNFNAARSKEVAAIFAELKSLERLIRDRREELLRKKGLSSIPNLRKK